MKVLIAPTEDFIKRTRVSATADVAAGSGVSIPVDSTEQLVANEYIVYGLEGSDGAELVQIISVVDATHITATIQLAHKVDEPIVVYRFNKRKFYGSLTAAGPFTELTTSGSPKIIIVNNPQGTLIEYAGGEGYSYFKATYWNSTTSEESNIADANAVQADESTRYCSIYAIKKQAGLTNNPFITDGIIETYRKRAESEVDSYLNARYILPLLNSQSLPEIPWMVENCTVLLAAGYIDWEQLGQEGEGVKWLGQARGILGKLQSTGGQQLLGADKQEMQTQTRSSGVTGNPSSNDDTNRRKFGMNQTF